ncbi:hypothetical protein WJX74_008812 [Apatococcus lobatus]|uniref:RRM domain-containing protein n=1 Tax=Apatococcus lobatus TaxID=904363 RepID=A0AAW1S2R6_9CHLO
MAPHSSLSGSPGWTVGPAGFTSSGLMDSPARAAFAGHISDYPPAPAFTSYVPSPFLPAEGFSYPAGILPGKAFAGSLENPGSGFIKPMFVATSGHIYQTANTRVHDAPHPSASAPPSYRQSGGESLDEKLESLSLNPQAKEFVPPASSQGPERQRKQASAFAERPGATGRRKFTMQRQLNLKVKRTIYICDIDQSVTEEELAEIFDDCGPVQDCRVCGDPNSAMRFAFIEFRDEEAVSKALAKAGMRIGSFSLRILPSKTAIVPVNNKYLPRSEEERELCSRTIYVANIDKRADRKDVKAFFENLCGSVTKLRLLGDSHHMSRIAFVEFFEAESAHRALDISGALLGMLPLRISPSKTPVRSSPTDIQSDRNKQRPQRAPGSYSLLRSCGSLSDKSSLGSS